MSPRGSVSIPGEEGTDELEDYEILTSIRDMADHAHEHTEACSHPHKDETSKTSQHGLLRESDSLRGNDNW